MRNSKFSLKYLYSFYLLGNFSYVIWNINTKLEFLEDWISDFIITIEKVQRELKQIDYRGSFEADDETGVIFQEIKAIVSQLNRFKGEEQ